MGLLSSEHPSNPRSGYSSQPDHSANPYAGHKLKTIRTLTTSISGPHTDSQVSASTHEESVVHITGENSV